MGLIQDENKKESKKVCEEQISSGGYEEAWFLTDFSLGGGAGLFSIGNGFYWSWWDDGDGFQPVVCVGARLTGSHQPTVPFWGIWSAGWHRVVSLKSAMVGMFILQTSANTTNRGSLSPPASSSAFSCTLLALAFSVSGIHPYPEFFFFLPVIFGVFLFVCFSYTRFCSILWILWQKPLRNDKKRCVPSNVNYIFLYIGENSNSQKTLQFSWEIRKLWWPFWVTELESHSPLSYL